jgi:ESS family glutamate:Na+ symporter
VASIKLSVIVKYAVPLIVLIVLGTTVTFLITFYFGRRLSKNYWFERTIFAWGWWTGTMAMGIALLRIVDPKLSSKAMEDYDLAYLPIAPLEILLITFVPVLFANGMGVWLLLGCLALAALTILVAWLMKWFVPVKKE